MKGTLEFDLETEKEDFDLASHAMEFKFCVDDFMNLLRIWNKHGFKTGEIFTPEAVRHYLYECFKDRDMERF